MLVLKSTNVFWHYISQVQHLSVKCVQVWHFGSNWLFTRYREVGIVWKGYVWRLRFQIQNKNIPIVYVKFTTLKYMPTALWTAYMSNIGVINFYQNILGWFNKIIVQRYDIFISFEKTFDTELLRDAMPVSLRSELSTSYILTIFKQRNLLP